MKHAQSKEKRTDIQAMDVLLAYNSGPGIPRPEGMYSGIKGYARLARTDASDGNTYTEQKSLDTGK